MKILRALTLWNFPFFGVLAGLIRAQQIPARVPSLDATSKAVATLLGVREDGRVLATGPFR